MRLDRLELINFRCFKSQSVQLSNYCAFVGPNNGGKSTLFKAVEIFFRSTQKSHPLLVSDFNDEKLELRIVLTFSELPEKAEEEFSHYVRHGKLEFFIRAKVVEERIEASIHGRRSGIRAFGKFYETQGATAQKSIYPPLNPAKEKENNNIMRQSLRDLKARVLEYVDKHNDSAMRKARYYISALDDQLALCDRTDQMIDRLCQPLGGRER